MSKTLLLDFDGVIFNNPRMNRMIQHRATIYFQHYTQVPYKVASKLNAKFYKNYGHTVTFMKDIMEYPNTVDIQDFNEFVYSTKTLDTISKEMRQSDIHLASLWCDTIAEFREHDYAIKIFSNAPQNWIHRCLEDFPDYDLKYMFDDCFCFDNLNFMKPKKESYMEVYDHEEKIVFVDDSVDNLKPLFNNEDHGDQACFSQCVWYPVHFGKSNTDSLFSTTNPLTIQQFI